MRIISVLLYTIFILIGLLSVSFILKLQAGVGGLGGIVVWLGLLVYTVPIALIALILGIVFHVFARRKKRKTLSKN